MNRERHEASSVSQGNWLARKDSNLQSPDPESGALPFGHSPAARAQSTPSLAERSIGPPGSGEGRLGGRVSDGLLHVGAKLAPDGDLQRLVHWPAEALDGCPNDVRPSRGVRLAVLEALREWRTTAVSGPS